jgi:DNA-binding transcriptional LysR family regulator
VGRGLGVGVGLGVVVAVAVAVGVADGGGVIVAVAVGVGLAGVVVAVAVAVGVGVGLIGVALSSDAFSYMFGDQVKLLRLTPEPKRVAIGIIMRRGKLSPAAEKFCQCAKDEFAALR